MNHWNGNISRDFLFLSRPSGLDFIVGESFLLIFYDIP